MAEVPTQRIIDRYKDILSQRTHDTIVRDLALDVVEAELSDTRGELEKLKEDHERLKEALARANEALAKERGKPSKTIPGEVVKE